MLRSLRKAAVSIGLKKDDDHDAVDKKRLADLSTHTNALKNQMNAFTRSMTDHGNHAASLHQAMADVYPPSFDLTHKLDALVIKREAFLEASKAKFAEAKMAVDGTVSALTSKHKELSELVVARSGARQDIFHYKEKIAGLQIKVTTDPKMQHKVDENKVKLEACESKFNLLEAQVVPLMEKLDADIAACTTSAVAMVLAACKDTHASLSALYAEAEAATPGEAAAAALAANAAASAAASEAGAGAVAGAGAEAVPSTTAPSTPLKAPAPAADGTATPPPEGKPRSSPASPEPAKPVSKTPSRAASRKASTSSSVAPPVPARPSAVSASVEPAAEAAPDATAAPADATAPKEEAAEPAEVAAAPAPAPVSAGNPF